MAEAQRVVFDPPRGVELARADRELGLQMDVARVNWPDVRLDALGNLVDANGNVVVRVV